MAGRNILGVAAVAAALLLVALLFSRPRRDVPGPHPETRTQARGGLPVAKPEMNPAEQSEITVGNPRETPSTALERAPESSGEPVFAEIVVTVRDRDGLPIEGARVWVIPISESEGFHLCEDDEGKLLHMTDVSGRLRLLLYEHWKKCTKFALSVGHAGHAGRAIDVDRPADGEVRNVEVTLEPGFSIAGVILGLEPQSKALDTSDEIRLVARADPEEYHGGGSVEVREDGAFIIHDVPARDVSLSLLDFRNVYEPVDIRVPYPFAPVTVRVKRNADVGAVTFRCGGSFPKGTRLSIFGVEERYSRDMGDLSTEPVTMYLPLGSYVAVVSCYSFAESGGDWAGCRQFEVRQDFVEEIALEAGPGASLSLKIPTLSGNEHPSVRVMVPVPGGGYKDLGWGYDGDGPFEMSSLLPGYVVRVEAKGYEPAEHTVMAGRGAREEATLSLVSAVQQAD